MLAPGGLAASSAQTLSCSPAPPSGVNTRSHGAGGPEAVGPPHRREGKALRGHRRGSGRLGSPPQRAVHLAGSPGPPRTPRSPEAPACLSSILRGQSTCLLSLHPSRLERHMRWCGAQLFGDFKNKQPAVSLCGGRRTSVGPGDPSSLAPLSTAEWVGAVRGQLTATLASSHGGPSCCRPSRLGRFQARRPVLPGQLLTPTLDTASMCLPSCP